MKFFNTGKEYDADEVGVLKMELVPRNELRTGDVGYIISGIKTSKEVKVGDTITHVARPCDKAIAGFEEVSQWFLPESIRLRRKILRICVLLWKNCS